jgi:hypothetical protein
MSLYAYVNLLINDNINGPLSSKSLRFPVLNLLNSISFELSSSLIWRLNIGMHLQIWVHRIVFILLERYGTPSLSEIEEY